MATAKWCLVGCVDSKCPKGGACNTYWPTRTQVCASSAFPKACSSVTDGAACAACGMAQFTTACTGTMLGTYCPANAQCDPNGDPTTGLDGCACASGFEAVSCDGGLCSDPTVNCVPPGYSCRQLGNPQSTCVDEPEAGAGTCTCADGRHLPFVCGQTSSCEQRCSTGCSLTLQDCPDAWLPKCSILIGVGGATLSGEPIDRTWCVALTGNKAVGELCTRAPLPDGGNGQGYDNCARGLFCDGAGSIAGETRCHKLCTASMECAPTETCQRSGLTFPPSGFCVAAACTLGGTECGAGRSCMWVRSAERERVPVCKFDGPTAIGGACQLDADCGANLGCGSGICRVTCSGSKPCVSGTCEIALHGDAASPGLCK